MRPDPETFAAELIHEDAAPGGTVAGVPWAVDSWDNIVFIDADGNDSLAFRPDDLREIADDAEAQLGGDGTEESDDTDPNQWEDSDILLQNTSNTVGLAETDDALKPLSADAQSVLVTPDLLRECLDVAVGIGTKDRVWLTVEHDRPAVVTPMGEMNRLSAVVTPRINMSDETPPAEDI